MTPLERFATPRRRRWAYAVTTAGLGVLMVYGILTAETAAAWAGLAAAVTGMAAAFTDPAQPAGLPRRAAIPDE